MRLDTSRLKSLRSSSRCSCQNAEVDHQHDGADDEQVEGDPLRPEEEPVHAARDGIGDAQRSAGPAGTVDRVELPDFHIPHAEKIEWMIETDGFAIEPIPPEPDWDPPRAGYTYTIGFTAHTGFPDIVVFGLTPVAARGLIGLVADRCVGGTEIPIQVELVGLLDNELRCEFAPVNLDDYALLFQTAASWYRGEPFEVVQLLYPDRNGFMPYEPGFDQRCGSPSRSSAGSDDRSRDPQALRDAADALAARRRCRSRAAVTRVGARSADQERRCLLRR